MSGAGLLGFRLVAIAVLLIAAVSQATAQLSRVRCVSALEAAPPGGLADHAVTFNNISVCTLQLGGGQSDYVVLPSSEYDVAVDGNLLSSVTLATGVSYTISFVEWQGALQALLTPIDETFDISYTLWAGLRVVCLNAPGSALIDVNVDGTTIFGNVSSGNVTMYADVGDGTHSVTIAGTTFQQNIVFDDTAAYSLYVWSNGAQPAAVVVVDFAFIPLTGRVLHMAYGHHQPVDVYFDNGIAATMLFPQLAYTRGYYRILAWQSNVNSSIVVKAAGGSDTVLLQIFSPGFTRFEHATLLLASSEQQPTEIVGFMLTDDLSAPAESFEIRSRFVVATPSFPPLDLRVDDLLLASAVGFGQASAVATAPNYRDGVLRAFRNGEQTNAVATTDHVAGTGGVYTVVLYGSPDGPSIAVFNDTSYNFARVTFTHASPDAGPVDVYIDHELSWTGLAYGNNQSAAVTVTWNPGKEYLFQVYPAGTNQTVLYEQWVKFPMDYTYTVVFAGLASAANATAADNGLTLALSTEFFGVIEDSGIMRFIHAAPESPPLDLLVNGTALAWDTAYLNTTEYNWSFPTGVWDLQIRVSGTEEVVWEQQYNVRGTSVHTVVAEGIHNNATFPLHGVATLDWLMLPPGRLRVLNALSSGLANDSGVALDSFVDGLSYVTDIEAFKATQYFIIRPRPPGDAPFVFNFALAPSGALVPKVADGPMTLASNEWFTFVATGTVAAPQTLMVQDDSTLPAADQASVRFFQLAPSITTPISLSSPNATWFTAVAFLHPAAYITVSSGTYNLKVEGPNGTVTAGVFTFAGASVYTLALQSVGTAFELRSYQDASPTPPSPPPPSPPPPPPPPGEEDKHPWERLEVIIAASVLAVVIVAVVAFFVIRRYRNRRGAGYRDIDEQRLVRQRL